MAKNTALEDRYPLWFDQNIGFVGSTDEKGAITDTISMVLKELVKTRQRPVLKGKNNLNLADLGCAAGVLGKMVGDELHEKTGRKINYLGIDVNEHLQSAVTDNVTGKAFESTDFQRGSTEKLAAYKPDVILASHIYYYPDNASSNPEKESQSTYSPLHKALLDTMSSMNADSVAFIAHESKSDFDPIKRKYGAHVEGDTTKRLDNMLKPSLSSAASSVTFKTHIYFPDLNDSEWARLKKAEHYDSSINPYEEKKLLNARILAEFMIHKPLENMTEDDRSNYINDLKRIVIKTPLLTAGPHTEKFGTVHEMTNENQLIIRTQHKNISAGQYVKGVIANINANSLAV